MLSIEDPAEHMILPSFLQRVLRFPCRSPYHVGYLARTRNTFRQILDTRSSFEKRDILCRMHGMRVTRTLQILFRISRLPPAACIRSSPFSVCLSSLVRRKTRGNRLQFDAGEQRTLRFSFGTVSTPRRPWNTSFSLDEYGTFRRSRFRSFRYFWWNSSDILALILVKKKRENWRRFRVNFVS